MEFRIRNCDPNGPPGTATKTCHCHEGDWINSVINLGPISEPWKSLGFSIAHAYGQFYRTGTFPANTLLSYKDMNYNKFNVIEESFYQENVRDNECDALDAADNYLWDKWAFDGNWPEETTPVVTSPPPTTKPNSGWYINQPYLAIFSSLMI